MLFLNQMQPEQIVFLASTLAIKMSQNLNVDDLSLLSDFFSVLGDNLGMIASRRAIDTDLEVVAD